MYVTIRTYLATIAFAVVSIFATGGHAVTYNLGDATYGASASERLPGARTADFFKFSIAQTPRGHIFAALDIDTLGSAFNTEIGLFDSADKLVASNVNGGAGYGSASRMLFTGANVPVAGDYTLVIGAWNIRFAQDLAGNQYNGYPSGTYNINIATSIVPVPLPAGVMLSLTGLAVIGGLGFRRKRMA